MKLAKKVHRMTEKCRAKSFEWSQKFFAIIVKNNTKVGTRQNAVSSLNLISAVCALEIVLSAKVFSLEATCRIHDFVDTQKCGNTITETDYFAIYDDTLYKRLFPSAAKKNIPYINRERIVKLLRLQQKRRNRKSTYEDR